jgi:hypothetical protein
MIAGERLTGLGKIGESVEEVAHRWGLCEFNVSWRGDRGTGFAGPLVAPP